MLGKLFRTTAFKLSAAYLVLFAFGAFMALGGVGWRVKQILDEQIAENVDASIERFAASYSEGGIRQLILHVERHARAPGGSLVLVMSFSGDTLAGNIEPPARLPGVEEGLVETDYRRRGDADATEHQALLRLFVLPGGFRLIVGHDIDDHRVLRQIMRRSLGASLFWLVLIGTLGGLFVAHQMLERVERMSASARRIMAGDLGQRLTVTGAGDELDRLAQNLNAMLARIEELMRGLREVSDNIAHDLKTPLTRLRNHAEAAVRSNASAEQQRTALLTVIEESDQLIRVFDALLMIARAEAGYSSDHMAAIDVSQTAHDIVELYEPLAEEQGAALEEAIEPGLSIMGNRELLSQALVNLVDNALKYGAEGQDRRVALGARRNGDRVEIIVADHGPGVAPEDRERVMGRFVRLENSRSRPGSGLGLSLASAVARLHGGVLRLEDNQPGLRALLSLPCLRRPPQPALKAG